MVYKVRHNVLVITGTDLKRAREALGLTQAEFGKLVQEEGKTVGNWERADRIPVRKREKVRTALVEAGMIEEAESEALSDVELIAALTARLAWYAGRLAESSGEDPHASDLHGKTLDTPTSRAAWTERDPRQRRQSSVSDSTNAGAVEPRQGAEGEMG
jgi:transcriptional regulator with XRE-family HTH domain